MRKNKEKQEDIVYEPDSDDSSSLKTTSLEKLKKKLKACEEEKKEYLEGWQKARADLVNLRKQDEQELQRVRKFASEEIVTELISVIDSFDMAFSNKESWESVSAEWRKGVEYIYNQLTNTLETYGLEDITPKNEIFNPQKHEAVEIVEGKDNIVVEVIQKGYELNGKIIRTAKVKVGKTK